MSCLKCPYMTPLQLFLPWVFLFCLQKQIRLFLPFKMPTPNAWFLYALWRGLFGSQNFVYSSSEEKVLRTAAMSSRKKSFQDTMLRSANRAKKGRWFRLKIYGLIVNLIHWMWTPLFLCSNTKSLDPSISLAIFLLLALEKSFKVLLLGTMVFRCLKQRSFAHILPAFLTKSPTGTQAREAIGNARKKRGVFLALSKSAHPWM